MTELERAPEQLPAVLLRSHGNLQDRANDLVSAGQIGRALSQTMFAPAAFRGKPEEAAAAIVFGDELGLTPMQSLRSIYVISGTPALYSRVMVALVLGAGHDIWTVEDAPGKVTVAGRRRGSTHVEEVTWTTARAQTAGYTTNKKYQSDSQSMLYARAAGDVARRIAPDVLLGVPYAVEEIELSEVETTTLSRTEPAKPARVARKAVAAPPEPEPDIEPEPEPVRPPRVLRPVDDVPLPDPGGVTPTGDRPGMITAASLRMLHVMLGKNGMGQASDRDLALAFYEETVGRPVESSKLLTKQEAAKVIDRLVQMEADGREPVEAELVEEPLFEEPL